MNTKKNQPTSGGLDPALACKAGAQDASVLDRLAWINERVEIVQGILDEEDDYIDPLLVFVLGTVEEFAELLRIHFAGVEA